MSEEGKQLTGLIEKQAGIMEQLLARITACEVWQEQAEKTLDSLVACDKAQQNAMKKIPDMLADALKSRRPAPRGDLN